MATKPNVYPEFSTSIDADGIGTITDPVSGQQNAQPPAAQGYSVIEGLKLVDFISRQLFNHLLGLANNWIKWLDQEMSKINPSVGTVFVQAFTQNEVGSGGGVVTIGAEVEVPYSILSGFINLYLPVFVTPNRGAQGEGEAVGYYFTNGSGAKIDMPSAIRPTVYGSVDYFNIGIGKMVDDTDRALGESFSYEYVKDTSSDYFDAAMKNAIYFRVGGINGDIPSSGGINLNKFLLCNIQAEETSILENSITYKQ